MSDLAIGIALLSAMLLLMGLRVPIAIAMFAPGAIGYALLSSPEALLNHLKSAPFARLSVYDLSVIPLFLLMGQFAAKGGLSRALFELAAACVGHRRGGMASASVLACAAFGSICGSSVATAATVSQVALPEMRRHNYSGRFATATMAAGGTLGILIPPSVPLVVYAILAEQNIAKLFAAAFIPGFLAAALYLVAIAVYTTLRPHEAPSAQRQGARKRIGLLIRTWPIAAIFLLLFGGIYAGWFTPTEGAGIGAAATLISGVVQRELDFGRVRDCFLATAETAGMIFLIFLGADMLNSALALSHMPAALARTVGESGFAPVTIVAAILAFYIVLGCVMDELAMLLLTIPIVFPMVMGLDLFGLDATGKALWFGILVLCVVEIGLIAPPVGLNVYVVHSFARDVPMGETYRGVVPYLAADAVRIALLFAFPALSLWLVGVLT
jgi:C4-dicarboxylate transporter DctM subunit